MARIATILLGAAAVALAGPAAAQQTITTPEGAQMSAATDLAYKPGELTEAQLTSSTREPVRAGFDERIPPLSRARRPRRWSSSIPRRWR